jgi:hypothetical protein
MIYRTQPCHGLQDSKALLSERSRTRHQLADLEQLWNQDKHRMLQPVVGMPMNTHGRITGLEHCEIVGDPWMNPDFLGNALEPGTEVFAMRIRRTGPNPFVRMNCKFVCEVAFANGLPAEKALADIGDWVESVLEWFIPEFETPRARRLWGVPRGGWTDRNPIQMNKGFYQLEPHEPDPAWASFESERLS